MLQIPNAVTVNEALAEEEKIDDTCAQIAHGNCIECGARFVFPPESRKITCFCRRTIEIALVPQNGIREIRLFEQYIQHFNVKTDQEYVWLVKVA